MLDDATVKRFAELFLNREDIYFSQWSNGSDYGYRCIDPSKKGYEPLELKKMHMHLAGSMTLSVVAVDKNGMCKWACWDNDQEDGALDALETLLRGLGFSPLRESKRNGRDGHVWLVFDQPVAAARLIRVSEEFRRQLGWKKGQVEFFPKSVDKLSQVRLPLGINRKPEAKGARGWFEAAPHSIPQQLAWFAAQPLNDSVRWNRIAEALEKLDREAVQKATQLRKKVRDTQRRYEQADIRQLVPELRQRGGEFIGPCPVCRMEGHDRHGDNLRVSLDGTLFTCVYGSPGAVHRAADIIRALST